jgi:hypothetical protein
MRVGRLYGGFITTPVMMDFLDCVLREELMSSIFDLPEFQRLLNTSPSDQQVQVQPAIALYNDPYRQREREDIERIFSNLPVNSYKPEIQRRLLLGDIANHLGAWYELMVYDWLATLGKNPTPQPPKSPCWYSYSDR